MKILFGWCEGGNQLFTFKPSVSFDFSDTCEFIFKVIDNFVSKFRVGNLPTGKLNAYFNIITFVYEFPGSIDSGFDISGGRKRASDSDFFSSRASLAFSCLGFLFLFLIEKFLEIDDFSNRWFSAFAD